MMNAQGRILTPAPGVRVLAIGPSTGHLKTHGERLKSTPERQFPPPTLELGRSRRPATSCSGYLRAAPGTQFKT
jgi:hypothetical protein